ncbi:MAG: DnaJ domain-containing protein [Candidatus Micrarchaeota archaeon]|nr:DnaJ domain-containing protein [Candidatus Micrarchaeota archaeon]
MVNKDYYKILGISKGATRDEVKEAYRKLVLKYHPDVNKDSTAEAKMQEINEAYAVLIDENKRKQYDSFGPEGFSRRFSEDDIFKGFNFEDIIREFEENVFTGGFGGFGQTFDTGFEQQQEQTGVNLYLSFSDIEKGVDREFEVQRYKICAHCSGTGGEPGSKQVKCDICNGSGRRHVQQNTFFGRFDMVTTCNKCKGKGKIYEKACRECKGGGRILVKERFRIKADKIDSGSRKGKFGIF